PRRWFVGRPADGSPIPLSSTSSSWNKSIKTAKTSQGTCIGRRAMASANGNVSRLIRNARAKSDAVVLEVAEEVLELIDVMLVLGMGDRHARTPYATEVSEERRHGQGGKDKYGG